jgi:DNA-binding PadR family transcriptional regulator
MHKLLMLLGLLLPGPLHGYELHRIVRAHGELYADLGKANVYYLLDRLARDGCVAVRSEPGARGARGERLVYELTDRGRARFEELLRALLLTFEPAHTGPDVAVVFLRRLPPADAVALLEERRALVAARRERAAAELGDVAGRGLLGSLAAEHLLALIDAELAWVERAIDRLRAAGWATGQPADGAAPAAEQHGG